EGRLTRVPDRAAPPTTTDFPEAARMDRRRAVLRPRARTRCRDRIEPAPGPRNVDRCRSRQQAGCSRSGWRYARFLCGATERTDGVWQIELACVDATAPRRKLLPRTRVGEQSERF